MKLNEVSSRIAVLISRVTATMITPIALGRMCLKMIRRLEAPATRAASTNSRSRRDKKSPRTSRARGGQEISPSAIPSGIGAAEPNFLPNRAPMTITGIVMMRSVNRMRTVSV